MFNELYFTGLSSMLLLFSRNIHAVKESIWLNFVNKTEQKLIGIWGNFSFYKQYSLTLYNCWLSAWSIDSCYVVNDAILYPPLLIISYPLTKSDVKGGKSSGTCNTRILGAYIIMLHELKHYKHLNLNNEILIKDTVREMRLKEAWRAASTMIIIAIQYTVLQVLSACLDSGNIITLFSQINNS